MTFPLRLPDQLTQHLRALRKSHGLTQARLGALIGVKQARMAEIEANPGAVSLDQLTKILAVLGGTLHLHAANAEPPQEARTINPEQEPRPHSASKTSKKASATAKEKSAALPRRSNRRIDAPAAPQKRTSPAKPAPRANLVIRPKKGTW
jgi:HTH-type transcriptional regulator / antitoxin HipB